MHLSAFQSVIDDGNENYFVYHSPPAENQSISCQVREAKSNVKNQGVDWKTLDILSEINTNNLVLTNTGPPIPGQLADVAKRY